MIQPHIVVITYNTPHRKTQDVLFGLKARGYQNITVLALPFVQRENPFKPIYQHRPSQAIDVETEKLCSRLVYQFKPVLSNEINGYLNQNSYDYVLIAGAGLLPDELVENHKLINSHPGWLPNVRGLDSLKWAIHHQEIIGVTCHFVDAEADAGFLIEQVKIPIYANDTFHSFAYRQYETEIDLLVKSIEIIPQKTDFPSLHSEAFIATRRMPKAIEENIMADFEAFKTRFAQN